MAKLITIRTRKGKTQEIEVRDLREKFYQIDDAYLNGWARKCGLAATGVYNVLCRHVGSEQSCFPSVALIGDKLGISGRQVTRAVKILEAHNIIKVERFAGEKNIYWLTNKTEWREATIKWHQYENCRPAAKDPVDAMTYVDKHWPNRIRPRGDA